MYAASTKRSNRERWSPAERDAAAGRSVEAIAAQAYAPWRTAGGDVEHAPMTGDLPLSGIRVLDLPFRAVRLLHEMR
jgi:hypothetical protein